VTPARAVIFAATIVFRRWAVVASRPRLAVRVAVAGFAYVDRTNMTVGFLAMAATVVVIPASIALLRDSTTERQAIAVLRAPRSFEIRGSHILDAAMYNGARQETADQSAKGLELVSFVSSRADAEATLLVWNSVKAEPLIRRAGMSALVSGVGDERVLDALPAGVAVNHVNDPEEFSIRTGIRVLPFAIVIAGGDSVLAAGPGLPDESFIRDAAERFVREGPRAATRFRLVTFEINFGLTGIEALFPSSSAKR
jgi:hypothetical protein